MQITALMATAGELDDRSSWPASGVRRQHKLKQAVRFVCFKQQQKKKAKAKNKRLFFFSFLCLCLCLLQIHFIIPFCLFL